MDRKLSAAEIVGSHICVASEDGDKLYQAITEGLRAGDRMHVSFKGVDRLTTAFLNSAIGQLYNEFPEQRVRDLLSVDADPETLRLLKTVVDRAKVFYGLAPAENSNQR